MVEKLPIVQSRIEIQMIVMVTIGGKKENSKRFKKPGPEKRNLIH